MRRSTKGNLRWFVLALSLVVVFWSGWALAPRQDCPQPVVAQDIEDQVLTLINQYRAENGAPPLHLEARLEAAAEWKADDLQSSDIWSHTDSLGREPYQRWKDFGYPVAETYTGEILVMNYGDAETALRTWQASPSHDAALRDKHYVEAGVGFTEKYGAVEMGSGELARETPVPTPEPTPESTPETEGGEVCTAARQG